METNENEKNGNVKKVLVPAIIAVMALVVLTVGATYAYFSISTSTSNYTTRTASASAASVGSVALASGTNLTMSVTAAQMMKGSSDITYYASSSGTTTTATTETIGTATVTGSGTYTCNYTLTVSATATTSMYTAFQGMTGKAAGQIVLTVNNGGTSTTLDFNTASLFPKTISGTMTGLTSSASKTITAQLKLVNSSTVDQSALAGTDITLSFAVSGFTCTATA